MITLATLPQATAQEVFDQVKNHLLKQNEKSYDPKSDRCMYRAGNLSCAAGCLMGDDEYKPEFEKLGWWALAAENKVPDQHEDLICKLQRVHDQYIPTHWSDQLQGVAAQFGLDYVNNSLT